MKRKFTTTLEEDLLKRIKLQAVKEDTSVSEILEKLIEKYLEENEEQ